MVGNVLELVKSFQGRLLETKRKKEFWIFTKSEIMQTSYILKYARYELLIAIIEEMSNPPYQNIPLRSSQLAFSAPYKKCKEKHF